MTRIDWIRWVKLTVLLLFVCGTGLSMKTAEPVARSRTSRYTPRSSQEARHWQEEVRKKLGKLLKLERFPEDKQSLGFDAKELASIDHETFTLRKLEINATKNRRMTLLVTLPKQARKPSPAVVAIGGHSSTLFTVYSQDTIAREENKWDRYYHAFGTELAAKGYVTITTLVSQHEIYEEGNTLLGERLWDLMRCLDYLESLPEVDAERIGCGGLSLGGEMAMWLAAMDERIYATVSSGFLTLMDQLEQGHCECWKLPGLRDLVDFPDIYALIAPRPLQCQNGLRETPDFFNVPLARKAMEQLRMTYVDVEHPENAVLDVHPGEHEVDLAGLMYFFEKHLQNNRLLGED